MIRQHTRRLATGIATYVPGVARLSERRTGGTDSAEYCYQVWLRHLSLAASASLPTDPRVVVEFGPGDSIGTGIAALLTGVSTYRAVDLVEYAVPAESVEMIDAIRRLLELRTAIPPRRSGESALPFPHHVLTDERLASALEPNRVEAIRGAVADPGSDQRGISVAYAAGEDAPTRLDASADVVFSQAVLEHVDDLHSVYATTARLLRPGGFSSHQIDFKSHRFARDWNGHWTFGDRTWALVRGRRRFAINREPLSTHLRLIEESGLEVVDVHRYVLPSAVSRHSLAPRFRDLSSADLETESAVVQAVKPPLPV